MFVAQAAMLLGIREGDGAADENASEGTDDDPCKDNAGDNGDVLPAHWAFPR
jgi:hypothetical protein